MNRHTFNNFQLYELPKTRAVDIQENTNHSDDPIDSGENFQRVKFRSRWPQFGCGTLSVMLSFDKTTANIVLRVHQLRLKEQNTLFSSLEVLVLFGNELGWKCISYIVFESLIVSKTFKWWNFTPNKLLFPLFSDAMHTVLTNLKQYNL